METNPTIDQVSTQVHTSNNNNKKKITVVAHNKVTAVPQKSPQPKSVQRVINNKDSSTTTTNNNTTNTTNPPNKKQEQRCVTEIVHNDHDHSKQNLAILCIGLFEDQHQKKPLMDVDSYPWSTIPRREIKPTQAALQEEIIRRSELRNLSHIRPFAWSRAYCIEWLMKHPIQGTVDIQFLHTSVQILKQKLFQQPKPTTTTTNGWNHPRIPIHGTGQYRAPYNTTNNNKNEPVFILPAPIQPKVSQQDTSTTQPELKYVTNTNPHKPIETTTDGETTVSIKPKQSQETPPTVPVTQKKRNRDEINPTTTTITTTREVGMVTMKLNTNPSQESESVDLTTPTLTNEKRNLDKVSFTENALERTTPMEEEDDDDDDDDENTHRNNNNNNNQQQQDHDHHVKIQLGMLQKEHQWREQEHQITMRERKFKEWCDIQVQIRLLRQDMEHYNNTNKEDDDLHIELVEDMKMLIQRKNEIAIGLGMKQKSSVTKQFIV